MIVLIAYKIIDLCVYERVCNSLYSLPTMDTFQLLEHPLYSWYLNSWKSIKNENHLSISRGPIMLLEVSLTRWKDASRKQIQVSPHIVCPLNKAAIEECNEIQKNLWTVSPDIFRKRLCTIGFEAILYWNNYRFSDKIKFVLYNRFEKFIIRCVWDIEIGL